MKFHIFVALVLCNFDFITNNCNYDRTDVYKLNIGDKLRLPSGCTDKNEIQSIEWFFTLNDNGFSPENVTSFAVPDTGDLLLNSLKENNNGSYHFVVPAAKSEQKQSTKIPVIVKCKFILSVFLPIFSFRYRVGCVHFRAR